MEAKYVLRLDFQVLQKPEPKLRARTKEGRWYTPTKTKNAMEELAREVLTVTTPKERAQLFQVKYGIGLVVFCYIPLLKKVAVSAVDRQLAAHGLLRPLSTPDADNYIKLVCDGLKGVLWPDDSIIVGKRCEKFYSQKPRWWIRVYEWEVNL